MEKVLVFLFFSTISLAYQIKGIYSKNQTSSDEHHSPDERPRLLYELRRLDLLNVRTIRDWLRDWKSYEMRQQIQKEMQRTEIERKEQERLKKEAERKQIFEKYLLASQGGSSVLRDFHTNRF